MPQATINNSVYVLTDAWEKPRILFTKDGSSAYLPMTTGTAENFWVTGTNGSSYRPLVTSTTSSSESASSSTTYYTVEEYSEGLTSVTDLTRASYYETTSGAKGYLSSITDLTKPAYYLTTSESPGQMSSITGLTAASAYAVSGYYSESFAQYTTSQQYNPKMFSVTDLYVDRVSDYIDPNDPKWTRHELIHKDFEYVRFASTSEVDTISADQNHYTYSTTNAVSDGYYTRSESKTVATTRGENSYTFSAFTFYITGNDNGYTSSTYSGRNISGSVTETSGYATGQCPEVIYFSAEYYDSWWSNAASTKSTYVSQCVNWNELTYYRGTSRSTTGYAGYIEVDKYYNTSFYTNDSRTQKLSNSYYLYHTYTSAYSGYLSSSQTTGYSGWLSRSSTSAYSGITSSSVSTSSSMSTTTWN